MIHAAAKTFVRFFLAALPAAAPACADTVVLSGKPPFHNVRIVGFRRGKLVFRGVCRETLRKPLGQVASFRIDGQPMLSNAEALVERDPAAAVTAYELALEQTRRGWLADLTSARLAVALDRAGRFARAARLWIDLLVAHPDWAAALVPRHPGPPGCLENTQVRRQLAAVYATHLSPDIRRPLATLWLELTLYDGLEPGPAGAGARSRGTARTDSVASRPAGEPPPLFGAVRRKRPGATPAADLRREAAGLRLPADTFVLQAVREALDGGRTGRADAILSRALAHVAPAERGPWLLLQQRCRIEAGRCAQAADALLALSERTPDPALAAEALYYVGVAHERMDRADVAADIYRELLERSDLPPRLRKRVQAGLARTGE